MTTLGTADGIGMMGVHRTCAKQGEISTHLDVPAAVNLLSWRVVCLLSGFRIGIRILLLLLRLDRVTEAREFLIDRPWFVRHAYSPC